ncbi:LysE family translocator [Pseudodesulfovibrio sp. zrk46]|uniref:LysE family translocator n=1 Tax=Pseudodesulfovibrio sp. zrk46 TaxID=2725288 RepID=UPI0014496CC7|nr:LysE family translocator [Pseudodesulfovibrio sp. zrk46]QJB55993.1 LysE family translocator [Pseudodesulfovibrio sp. zrk46]
MLGIHDLALFMLSGVLLNLTPGQDVAYIASQSASRGWKTGMVASLGISAGCLVHVLAASLGLSAILATSATAFTVVKMAGAAYLVWIGIQMWRNGGNGKADSDAPTVRISKRKVFSQGFLTNVLNPKVALFFLAFLPQFVRVDSPTKSLAFLVLGVIFTINSTVVNCFWVWSASRAAAMFGSNGRFSLWAKRAAGTLFVALGIRLAMADAS